MQLLLQGDARFRFGLIVNEAGPGSLRFALNDGRGTIVSSGLADRNYADGRWHALSAVYDPSLAFRDGLELSVVGEDGRQSEAVAAAPGVALSPSDAAATAWPCACRTRRSSPARARGAS